MKNCTVGILKFDTTDPEHRDDSFRVGNQHVWLPNEPTYNMPDELTHQSDTPLEGGCYSLTWVGNYSSNHDPDNVGGLYHLTQYHVR